MSDTVRMALIALVVVVVAPKLLGALSGLPVVGPLVAVAE